MGNLNVIILAGGISSRFWPLSEKNSYPFLGQTNIQIHAERFKRIRPSKVFVITNNDFNPNLSFTNRLVQKGSGMAGGVMTALKAINQDEEILVLNANDYYDNSLVKKFLDLRGVLRENNHSMVVGYQTQKYFPGGYLKLNQDSVTEIIEKPGEDNLPSNFVKIVFDYFPNAKNLLETIAYSKSDKDDLYEVAMTNMIKEGKTFKMLEYKGSWKTIKYPWQVLDVMDFFLDKIDAQQISPNAQISDKSIIKGKVIIESGVKIMEGAIVNGPVFIGKNSIVANNSLVRSSMVGENCVIGFSTEVVRSYLKNDIWLHSNYVGDSIFENNISLGSGSVTGNLRLDEQELAIEIKGEKIDTHRNRLGVIIGSNVRIGINASIMPCIKIGGGSFIGGGVLLDRDVPNNSFVKAKTSYEIRKNKFDITKTSRENFRKEIK